MELVIDTDPKCKKCYGRGYIGRLKTPEGQHKMLFCPKCVLPKARKKLNAMSETSATIRLSKSGTESKLPPNNE